MVIDETGSLPGITRHDFLPFGEELAGVGNRSESNGYRGDSVRQKFEQYERDSETGLDFAGSRYFASIQGRFTSPDDFFNDSHPADPQSWNLYTYVRNNPLKYIDPTGRNATVTYEIDKDKKQGKITINATIAIYATDTMKSKGLNDPRLMKGWANTIKSGIEGSWSGKFERDGITYTVETKVEVAVANDKQGAIGTGAQNVIAIGTPDEVNKEAGDTGIIGLSGRDPDNGSASYDYGLWNNSINGTGAGHEWGHLLGVGDRSSGAYMMNWKTRGDLDSATQSDYEWAFGGEIEARRPQSNFSTGTFPVFYRNGPPPSGTFKVQLRAARRTFLQR
jgi:RHS repeat-associated protein